MFTLGIGVGVFLDVFCKKFKKCKGGVHLKKKIQKKLKNFCIAYSVLKPFKTLKSVTVLKIMFSTSPWNKIV